MFSRQELIDDLRALGLKRGDVLMVHASVRAIGEVAGAGARVNPHVARFVAWGQQAAYLFIRQPWNYAFGRDSALERFVELDGKILLLGADHDNVTFLHYAEHVVDIEGKRVAKYRVPVLVGGQRIWRDMEEFNTAGDGMHPHWTNDFFSRIVDAHLDSTRNLGGLVGNAASYLMRARALLADALSVMRAVADDASALSARVVLPLPTRRD